MRIVRCTMAEFERTAALYDRAVRRLTETVNYPKWTYGVYPSAETVRAAILRRAQFLCAEGDSAVGAFVLDEDPGGEYLGVKWETELKLGESLVLHTLAVDPAHCGQGVGRFLVNACIAYAEERGYRALRLDVVPENFPARRLYEKLGFRFAGRSDLGRGLADIPEFVLYERRTGALQRN